jgi:DNA-binding transcriptional LysR family regulator
VPRAERHSGSARRTSLKAVWQQVRALERRLGTVLLRRRSRTVELTPDGRLVLDVVLPYVQGLDSLDRLIETRRAKLPPRLTVAAPPAQLSFTLHLPLQQFARAHPTARLSLLSELRSRQVERLVERGAADVGVLLAAADEPRNPALEYEPLFDSPLLLLTASNSRFNETSPPQFIQRHEQQGPIGERDENPAVAESTGCRGRGSVGRHPERFALRLPFLHIQTVNIAVLVRDRHD